MLNNKNKHSDEQILKIDCNYKNKQIDYDKDIHSCEKEITDLKKKLEESTNELKLKECN